MAYTLRVEAAVGELAPEATHTDERDEVVASTTGTYQVRFR